MCINTQHFYFTSTYGNEQDIFDKKCHPKADKLTLGMTLEFGILSELNYIDVYPPSTGMIAPVT